MLLVLLVAAALVTVFYYLKFGQLRPVQWRTLLTLRLIAVVLVVLLLFRPVVRFYREKSQRPSLVFLLDCSASMNIADDTSGITRFEQARGRILDWSEKLRNDFDLLLIPFAERALPVASVAEVGKYRPEGQATSLSRALVAAVKAAPKSELEAIFLFSDGIHNAARSPREVSAKMATRVLAVGVGAGLRSSASYRDIQVTALDCPERFPVNNLARIKASVDGVGLAGRVVTVTLYEDDQAIASQELVLDDRPGPQDVTFEFRPTVKGRHVYAVKIPPVAEEKIEENNVRSAPAIVVQPGIRVLYLEGTLRAEYGALVDRFLSKDPDLEFYAMVQTRRNVFVKRTNIEGLEFPGIPSDTESLSQFDVFIIGDLDSSYLTPVQQEAVVDRVRNGAGLIMLGGYRALGPGGYTATPLAAILPVELGDRDIGQITDPFLPELTAEGRQHPIFANIAEFFPTATGGPKITGLPELDGCTKVLGARPGASVLAVCPVTADRMPVLAVMPVERGRSVVFPADTTRKWQQGPRVLDQQSPFLQLWGQLVRWAAGREQDVEAKAGVTANTDKAYYEPDEIVQLAAVVRDARGEGTDKAKVEAVIRAKSGASERVTLTTLPGPGGHYGAAYEPTLNGTLEIEVLAELEGQKLAAEKLLIEVGRPYLEFEKLDLDEQTLSGIAADSGGRYLHISAADTLMEQLNRAERKKRIYLEQPLFSPLLFWLLFAVAVTTEWFLRRRFQMR